MTFPLHCCNAGFDLNDGDFQLPDNADEVSKEDNSDDDSDWPEGNAVLKQDNILPIWDRYITQ